MWHLCFWDDHFLAPTPGQESPQLRDPLVGHFARRACICPRPAVVRSSGTNVAAAGTAPAQRMEAPRSSLEHPGAAPRLLHGAHAAESLPRVDGKQPLTQQQQTASVAVRTSPSRSAHSSGTGHCKSSTKSRGRPCHYSCTPQAGSEFNPQQSQNNPIFRSSRQSKRSDLRWSEGITVFISGDAVLRTIPTQAVNSLLNCALEHIAHDWVSTGIQCM